MDKNSTLYKILLFIGFMVVASIVLNVVLALTGTLLSFAFKWGIPLLIAYLIVRWMTGYSQTRQNRRY